MAHKKKRPGTSRPNPERSAQHHSRHSTANRPLPADLPRKLPGPFHELVRAAESFMGAGGYLFVEASWWTDEDEVNSAVLSDRATAMVAAILCVADAQEAQLSRNGRAEA